MFDSVMEIIFASLIVILMISLLIMFTIKPCMIYHNWHENIYCKYCGEYIDKLPNCKCGKEYTSTEQKYCTECGKEKK